MIKKKKILLIFALVLILPFSLILSSCAKDKGTTTQLPSTKYEKVKFAFNGVESSLNKNSGGASKVVYKNSNIAFAADESRDLFNSVDSNDALNLILLQYLSDDDPQNNIDGISYNEPPMVQFQCLKSVIDKVGSDYKFGTKYYYTIAGTMYLDITTGQNMEENKADEFKYNYEFTLALEIDIFSNDLIDANVIFNIKLTQGEAEYNTQWYVYLNLDYDMKNTTPNYKLLMLTDNQEGELAYLNRVQGYEYDYVEVDNNQIKEWRKFELETNEQLVKDNTHQLFSTYTNQENFEYRVGNCKWYKNGTLHKFTRIDKPDGEEMKFTVASALYGGLNMNSTDIDSSSFKNMQGEENDVIYTIYRDFSKITGKNLVYSLVCKNEDDSNREVAGLSVKLGNGENWNEPTLENDVMLLDLLLKDRPWGEGFMSSGHPHIFLVDKNGKNIDKVEDFNGFTFKLTVNNETMNINLTDKLSDVLFEKFEDEDISQVIENSGFKFTITIIYSEQNNISVTISAYFGFDIVGIIESQQSKYFPKALINMGVPVYDTENGSFLLNHEKEDSTLLNIQSSNSDELNNYKNKLTSNGFVKVESNVYAKIVDENILTIRISNSYNVILSVKSEVNNNRYTNSWQADTISSWLEGKFANFPAPTGEKLLFNWGYEDKYVYIYGLTDAEKNAYLAQFNDLENVLLKSESSVVFLYNGYVYTIDSNYDSYSGYLFWQLNLERNGHYEDYAITINNLTTKYFKILENRLGYYITVSLNENDTFTFNYDARCKDSEYFSVDDETGVHTALVSGTYTLTYQEGMMIVIKK